MNGNEYLKRLTEERQKLKMLIRERRDQEDIEKQKWFIDGMDWAYDALTTEE